MVKRKRIGRKPEKPSADDFVNAALDAEKPMVQLIREILSEHVNK